MPLYNVPANPPKPDAEPHAPEARIYPKEYRHSVVSAKTEPLSALLTHIEGSTLVVDYYAQVLGQDEEPSTYQPGQFAVYQQYKLIKDFVIKQQGSWSIGEDQATMEMQITGSGIIFPGLKPNYGDVFIADIGDGKAGIFVLDVPTKNTLMKETCYNITFSLYRYATPDEVATLNLRVVDTLYYKQDYLLYGKNPIITESAVAVQQQLVEAEKTLLRHYLGDFYSREYKTLLVPNQEKPAYDRYVTHAMLSMYDRRGNPFLAAMRELNCDGFPLLEQESIYDLLLALDDTMLATVFTTMQRIPVTVMDSLPYMDGVRYSGVYWVVGPKAASSVVERQYNMASMVNYAGSVVIPETQSDLAAANARYIARITATTPSDEDDTIPTGFIDPVRPLYHAVGSDDNYVLSTAFFDNDRTTMTKIELLVIEAIENLVVPARPLLAMVEEWASWEPLDRFYYGPLLLAILRIAQRADA